MRHTAFLGFATIGAVVLLLGAAGRAFAQDGISDPSWERQREREWSLIPPGSHGQGAWDVRHAWSDRMSDRPDAPTFAEGYAAYVRAHADEWVGRDDIRRDCADFSISLVIAYAAENGLPIEFRVFFSHLRRMVIVRSTEARFHSREHFDEWARWHLGAQNLADNTFPVTYQTWAPGDMVLMDWNQSPEEPNFPGRTVWHTYLVGEPGRTAYYGNLVGSDQPTPITKIEDVDYIASRLQGHPDIHGHSPRRWHFLTGVRAPTAATGTVAAGAANVREGASTSSRVLARLDRGADLKITGTSGDWLRVELPDGRAGYIHGTLVQRDSVVNREAVVRATRSNVRAGPGTDRAVTGQLAQGTRVTILSKRGAWYRIAGPEPRWVHSSNLELVGAGRDGRGIIDVLGTSTGNGAP